MKRRDVLKGVGALGGLGMVTGCLSETGGTGGGETTETTEPPTSEQPSISMTNEQIETTEKNCKSSEPGADVTYKTDANAVAIDGILEASDPCHTAEFKDSAYDTAANELSVDVKAKAEDVGACQQCVGEIHYTAEVSFENGLPATVTVNHVGMDGDTATVAESSRE